MTAAVPHSQLNMAKGTLHHHSYGADLTRMQFIKLIFALCTGTLIEWFDFTVYSQLSSTITAVFFPPTNPTASVLGYWMVFAIGFIARPLGSILFGHLGDSHGRRLTLLLSILCVSVPTLLIGCLPTYQHIGLAAPILMAILRFIQGLAVGGEFGSAIVYLFETAPAHRKGTIASLGQAAIAPGILLGLLSVLTVLYACTPEQLLLWGWRVPFLLTIFFGPFALILRMHMPEPKEFLLSRQQMTLQHVASTAASRVASSFTRQHSSRSAGVATGPVQLRSRQLSKRLESLTEVVLPPLGSESDDVDAAADGTVGDSENQLQHGKDAGCAAAPAAPRLLSLTSLPRTTHPQLNPQHSGEVLLRVLSMSKGGPATLPGPSGPQPGPSGLQPGPSGLQPGSQAAAGHRTDQQQQQDLDLAVMSCEEEYAAEVQQLSGTIKHHVPLVVLFRDHWRSLLMLFLLEINYGTTFYTFFSWVPAYVQKDTHVSVQATLWPIVVAMVLFPIVVVLTGRYISDKAIPKVWTFMAVTAVLAVVSIPVLLWLHSGSQVALWLMLPIMLAVCGGDGGVLTSIGPQTFPAGVRASGYNLAHNAAMTVGGLMPLVVSALSVVLQPSAVAAGVVIVITAVVTWVGAIALVKVAPQTNARAPAGGY